MMEEIKAFEAEKLEMLKEVRQMQEEAIKAGATVDDEMARLKEQFEKETEQMKKKFAKEKSVRRNNLEDRIKHRRRAREAELRRKGKDESLAEGEVLTPREDQELKKLEDLEREALEAELLAEEKQLEQYVEAKKKVLDDPPSSEDELALLKEIHDRELQALQQRLDAKRQLAKDRLKSELETRRAILELDLAAEGKTLDEDALYDLTMQENAAIMELETALGQASSAAIQNEVLRQAQQLESGDLSAEELARLKEQNQIAQEALEKDLEYTRKMRLAALKKRIDAKRKAELKKLQDEGASDEEIQAVMEALDAEEERDLQELEALLARAEAQFLSKERSAAATSEGYDIDPDEEKTKLKIKFQEELLAMKASMEAEKARRKARLRQRLASKNRTRERESSLGSMGDVSMVSKPDEVEEAKQSEAVIEQQLKEEADQMLEELKQKQEKQLEEQSDDLEKLRLLKEKHEKASEDLKTQLNAEKQRQRELLERKLQKQRESKRKELEAKGLSEEEILAELAELEAALQKELDAFDNDFDQKMSDALLEEKTSQLQEMNQLGETNAAAKASAEKMENEIRSLRNKHRRDLEVFEAELGVKQGAKKRALEERLAKKRAARLAAAQSEEERQQIMDELAAEEERLLKALHDALEEEAQAALEAERKRHREEELAAREAGENAQKEHEGKLKQILQDHEQNKEKLEEDLAAEGNAKRSALRRRLEQRRKNKEQTAKDAEELSRLQQELQEQEDEELARLEQELLDEKQRLMQEEEARMMEEQKALRLQEQQRAADALAEAEQAEREAKAKLQELRSQHQDAESNLTNEFHRQEQQKRSKLQERLKKKRQAHEAQEMSETQRKQAEQMLLLEEAAMQRELEEELASLEQAMHQQLLQQQEEEAQAQLALAQRAAEEASRQRARAAALDLEKDRQAKMESEMFENQLKQLRSAHANEAKKMDAELQGVKSEKQKKLQDRIAKRKAEKQAELKNKMEAEKQRLVDEHKAKVQQIQKRLEERSAINQDKNWKHFTKSLIDKYAKKDLSDQEKEKNILTEAFTSNEVPPEKYNECVEMILQARHSRETSKLFSIQFNERASLLRGKLNNFFKEKAKQKQALLNEMAENSIPEEEKAEKLAQADLDFTQQQQEIENEVTSGLEGTHKQQIIELRQRHTNEINSIVNELTPDNLKKQMEELLKQQQEEDLQAYKELMEKEKQQRLQKIEEEKKAFQERIRRQQEEELKRIEDEENRQIEEEKAKHDQSIKAKLDAVQKERELAEKMLKGDGTDEQTKEEKEQLMKKFDEEHRQNIEQLQQEQENSRQKMQERLRKRREAKKALMEKQLADEETKAEKMKNIVEAQTTEAVQLHEQAHAVPKLVKQATFVAKLVKQASMKAGQPSPLEIESPGKPRVEDAALASLSPSERRSVRLHQSMLQKLQVLESAGLIQTKHAELASPRTIDWMKRKLDTIEQIIQALTSAQKHSSEQAEKATRQADEVRQEMQTFIQQMALNEDQEKAAKAMLESKQKEKETAIIYKDPEDAFPTSNLQILKDEDLPPQYLPRVEFGRHLLTTLGLPSAVTLQVAQSLEENNWERNAFGNSYAYDEDAQTLYIHVNRLGKGSGDVALVLTHAVSHIKTDPKNFSDDWNPAFIGEFYKNLRILYKELFQKYASVGGQPEAADKSQSTLVPMPLASEGSYFDTNSLQERMKQYASVAGNDSLASFLNRLSEEKSGVEKT